MIRFEHVSYAYPGTGRPALQDLNLQIAEAEFVLVCGPSGSGKSTLLRLFNGLVPHFHGGTIAGTLEVWGRNVLETQPRDLADLVGFVFQDPEAQFVVEQVEDELVFGMENLGLPQLVMRRRVEEVLDQLGIAHLRGRSIGTLSGGEKQRVAIAAVLAAQPRVLVLDEPTSQLDPHGAEEVLTALQKLNSDLGLTVILSEHRLERVIQYADRVLWLEQGRAQIAATREALAQLPLPPPLVGLARALDWQPLPLSIKEGRRYARQQSAGIARARPEPPAAALSAPPAARLDGVHFNYQAHEALYALSLSVPQASVLALMGRNGSGKSTLLRLLAGLLRPARGRIELFGRDSARMQQHEFAALVGYLPQDPRSILFHDTLREEIEFSLRARGLPQNGSSAVLLEQLGLAALSERYPRDFSGGEAQRAALAAILVGKPRLLLLDEPTRGLDYRAKHELARLVRKLAADGSSLIMATHDVELVAECADHVALLGDGELVVEGPSRAILGESLIFSPQIAKLFPGSGWLTVEQALSGLRG